jgi:cell fate (sporulation/competence/biofilm development) regulator YlbF (YheA/YmcA/DUF963 family)
MMMNGSFNDFQNFISNFSQLAADPAKYAMSHFGVSQNIANNPDAIIQQMMASGRISQAQYNSARQMASQIQNNPMFKQLFRK